MFLEFVIAPFNMRKKVENGELGNWVDFSGNWVDFHLLVGKPGRHFRKPARHSGNMVDLPNVEMF